MSNKEAIQRSGALLLQGWTMLNSNCPICYTALMATKDRSQCVCPSCDMPVKLESEMKKLGQTFTEKPTTTAPPTNSALPSSLADSYYCLDGKKFDEADYKYDDEDEADVPASLEEMKREWDLKTKSQDVVSGLIGEAMMSGWTMLATQCKEANKNHPEYQGVLLVSKGGVTKCVACEKKLGARGTDGGTNSQMLPPAPLHSVLKHTQPPAAEPKDPPVSDQAPASDMVKTAWSGVDDTAAVGGDVIDRASGLISQYLLKGYTMLDETCDAQCGLPCYHRVPLVKSYSDNKKVCVVCASATTAASANSHPKHVSFPVTEVDDDSEEDEETEEALRKIQGLKSLQLAQAHGLPASSTAAPTIHAHVSATVARHAGLNSAQNAIIQQICTLTEEMHKTSNLTAIKEYTGAINALVELVKNMATIA